MQMTSRKSCGGRVVGGIGRWQFGAILACVVAVLVTGCRDDDAGMAGWLVEDGQPRAEIVIAAEPARMTRLAAAELQSHIEKISGARLPIVNQPSGNYPAVVLVGVSEYTEKLGIDVDDLRYGAFKMVSGKAGGEFNYNWLALIGPDSDFVPIEPYRRNRSRGETERVERELDKIAELPFRTPHFSLYSQYHESLDIWEHDDKGTLNAVYEFLRDLGVRWYFPGEIGEIIPELASIPLPQVDEIVWPDFELRQIEFWHAFRHFPVEDLLWSLRMGIHYGYGSWPLMQAVHGMKYVHGRAEYKEMFPHHFAIWNGEPAFGHSGGYGAPNLNAEGLLENHVMFARLMFDHFDEPMVSIDPVDGFGVGVCETDPSQLQPERGRGGSMSDYVWGYVNSVAEELYRSHPDRMVSGLAYSTYQHPPSNIEQMSPNMAVLINSGRYADPETRQMWNDLRKQWLEILPSKRLYATGHFYAQSTPDQRGLPVYFPRLIAENLRELKDDVRGERAGVYTHSNPDDHEYHEHAIQHLNLYVTTRMWWDVDLDLDALLEEYYELYYGPAAAEMKAFIEFSEQNYEAMRSAEEPIREAQQLLAAAMAAAPEGSVYAQRIQMVDDYVLFDELAESQNRRRVDVPRLRVLGREHDWKMAGKKLDGRLDDDRYWPPQERFQALREVETGASADVETRIRFFLTADALYLGVRCAEPDMANLNRGDPEKGRAGIRDGDYIEILLETSTHSYYRISVSPDGVIFDADCRDGVNTDWTSAADAAVYHGDDFWSVEVRLPLPGPGTRLLEPWAGIDGRGPLQAHPWYFNIGRQRVRDGQVQRYAFAPTGSQDFEVLEQWAEMWSKYGR